MTDIRIDSFIPSSGAVPSTGYDPASQASYTEWELGDEGHFSVIVLNTYATGSIGVQYNH